MKREKSNESYFNTVLSSEENDNENFDKNFSSLTLQEKPKLKKPPFYKVIMLNDDYTPMEFVVFVLQTVFGHNHQKSTEIMMTVHTKGKGVCGIFSKEIAEMMSFEVNTMAKDHGHPLLSEIEPLTD